MNHIALADMEKIPADINIWLEMGLDMNNPLGHANVNKLLQAL